MKFNLLALDARQQVVTLDLEAANAALAAEQARGQGLTVISLQTRGRLLSKRSARFPTMLFSIELMSLLEAGLNLVEALQTLCEKEAHGERQEVLSGMLAAINRGEPFSQAVAGFPQHFSPLYVATIKASERTGNMREALGRYIATNISKSQVHELAVLKIQPDGSFENVGEIEDIAPEQGGSMQLDLEPGAYQLACVIVPGEAGSTVDHYQEGMHTDFTVTQ
jgi:general secretion pathway protein F